MDFNFRFAIASDLHIGLPQTILEQNKPFHLVEVSIPALEKTLNHLASLNLDFLLLPGDLTQDGEPENHRWLQQRLASLPFPVYVVPGNHDVPTWLPTDKSIGFDEFPSYYRAHGYNKTNQHYYTKEILPGVQLIALNSNQFSAKGEKSGCLDEPQLTWLEEILSTNQDKLILVMLHHNVIEHLPNQAQHPLGKRYMLDNAPILLNKLEQYGVKLIFTGHLHVQDIAQYQNIYEITTGSLVSYPHPYRILALHGNSPGALQLEIESHHIKSLPGWDNLPQISRQRLGEHSYPFMMKLLTMPPLNLSLSEAHKLAPQLRYFWADIAGGDAYFNFPDFPTKLKQHFESFSALSTDGTHIPIDNCATLQLRDEQ